MTRGTGTEWRAANLLLAIALLSASSLAGSRTTYNFLRTDVGARAAALAIEAIKKERITIEPLAHYHAAK